jgi:uncharacterized membrane protein YdjX (TVP38/TMEM64 family)
MVNGKAKQENKSKLPLIISFSLVGGIVASYFIFPGFHAFVHEAFDVLSSEDEARIKEWVSQYGMWGPAVIIFTMVIQMFLFIIPNILLIIIAILSYGPVWGSVIAWCGVFLASTVGFLIGSRLSPITVNKFVSANTQRVLSEFIEDYGMKAIVAIRLSTFSNDGLSIVAGLLKMSYKKFMIATLIGITPLIVILAIVRKNGDIKKTFLVIGAILIACLVLYIIIDKRRKKKHA